MAQIKTLSLITQRQLKLHMILSNSSEDYLRECAKVDQQWFKNELLKGVSVEEGPLCADIVRGRFRVWKRNGKHAGAA